MLVVITIGLLVVIVRSSTGVTTPLTLVLVVVLLILLSVVLVVVSGIVSCAVVSAWRLGTREVVSYSDREVTCNRNKSCVGGWTVLMLKSIQCNFDRFDEHFGCARTVLLSNCG